VLFFFPSFLPSFSLSFLCFDIKILFSLTSRSYFHSTTSGAGTGIRQVKKTEITIETRKGKEKRPKTDERERESEVCESYNTLVAVVFIYKSEPKKREKKKIDRPRNFSCVFVLYRQTTK